MLLGIAATLLALPATAQQPTVQTALSYIEANAQDLNLQRSDASSLAYVSSHLSAPTGISHFYFQQHVNGIPLHHGVVNVGLDRSGALVHAASRAYAELADVAGRSVQGIDAETAIQTVAEMVGLEPTEPIRRVGTRQAASRSFRPVELYSTGGIALEEITAHLVYARDEHESVRLAWLVELYQLDAQHYWAIAVDAGTNEVISVEDYVSHDHWGNESMMSLAPMVASPQQSSFLEEGMLGVRASFGSFVGVPDGSSYRVYGPLVESPIHTSPAPPADGRVLITNPAHPVASPFGWHDTDGAPGPEFTISRGNNVHAYTDWNNSNTPANTALYVTVSQGPATGNYPAVAASFGTTPLVHSGNIVLANDGTANPSEACSALIGFPAGAIALVDRGTCTFVEKVQNGQAAGAIAVVVVNNVAGAPIAMGGTSATITIPSVMISQANGNAIKAGGLPVAGAVQLTSPDSEAEGGPALAFDFPIDFTLDPRDYWEAAVTNLFYWNNVTHDIAYQYGFTEPAGNFQVNNYGRGGVGGDYVRAEAQDGGGTNNANFSTPAADGGAPRMQMYLWTTADPRLDGDLDAGIIVHEYAHGISFRLTGGPGINCLGGQEQMGEGWSDYFGLVFTDNNVETRGIGTYALNQAPTGVGIRPNPYTRDFAINSRTYDHIKSEFGLSQPHGIGFVWATMLWDMTRDLVDRHGFNPDVYADWSTGGNNLAIQLVMEGLKLQGCNPGFVDGRNAILAAEQALTGGANQCTIWGSFARRGLGYTADQGLSSSRNDGTEAFDMPATCTTFASIREMIEALRDDGVLNGGQANSLLRQLANAERMASNGQITAALNLLSAMINHIADFVENGVLTQEQGDDLIAQIEILKANILSGDAPRPTGPVAELESALKVGEDLPDSFALDQNFPNPFSTLTEIGFALPQAEHVRIVLYDLSGREISRLVDGSLQAGYHRVSLNDLSLANGVYIYRMEAGTFVETRRLTVIR